MLTAALAAACVARWMMYSYAAGGAALPARIGENLFESTNEWSSTVTPRVNVDVLASVADDVAREERGRAAPGSARTPFLLIVFGGVLAVSVVFYPPSRLLAPAAFVLMFYTGANVDR